MVKTEHNALSAACLSYFMGFACFTWCQKKNHQLKLGKLKNIESKLNKRWELIVPSVL